MRELRNSRLVATGLLAVFAVLVCFRMPEIVLKGRFWGEEGALFHNAWVMPPAQALLLSFGGYLNIVANGATLAARWLMPLRLAPYLTIGVALIFQLFPPLLWLTARENWARSLWVRLAGLGLLLAIPASEEIWLHTLHCQFTLTLCCGIILALDTASGRLEWFRFALLLLAPLCGPGAIVLVPLFIVRAALDRSRARLIQASVLAAGAAIQILLFFQAVPGRAYSLDPVLLLCVFTIRHLAVPFLGTSHAASIAKAVQARLAQGHVPLRATLLPFAVAIPLGVATLWHRRSHPAAWLLAACLLTAAVSYFGAIGGGVGLLDVHGGARYAYVPQALFALAILTLAATINGPVAIVPWVAVVWLLVVGVREYPHPWIYIADGPAWRPEVAAWRADPTHAIKIWPEGWVLKLPSSAIKGKR